MPNFLSNDLPQHANLRSLLNLRLLAFSCELLGILLAQTALQIDLPLLPLTAVLGFGLLCILWTSWRMRNAQPIAATGLFLQLLLDMLNWSLLVYFCGGATNPFVAFYLAILAVAAALLPGRLVAPLTILSLLSYTCLSYFYWPLKLDDSEQAVSYHLAGMWLNFALSALVIAWFVTRISASLRLRDGQLAKARERQLQNAQVLALGVQAANAAHAIATPLASIAILAGELRHAAEHDLALAAYLDDLHLIEHQISACQQALEKMRAEGDISKTAAEAPQEPALLPWLEGFLQQWRLLRPQVPVRARLYLPQAFAAWQQAPLRNSNAYGQILQTLLDNAAAAIAVSAAPDAAITLEIAADQQQLQIWVTDQGKGIASELLPLLGHAPVHSSTGGQGIGIWLACTTAEQIGAELNFQAMPEGGTRAILSLAE